MITNIKDRDGVRVKDVFKIQEELSQFSTQSSITRLRLEQMQTYLQARSEIALEPEIKEELEKLFRVKTAVLNNALEYIKIQYDMIAKYIEDTNTALNLINQKNNKANVRALQAIGGLWVARTIFDVSSSTELPILSLVGIFFLLFMIFFTVMLEFVINKVINLRKYKLELPKQDLYDKSNK